MKRRAGFTVLEVMVALAVMVIGSMGIIGMQQQTMRANVRAREVSTALQIAQTWIERLKLDGTRWTTVDNPAVDLAGTDFLDIDTGAGAGNGTGGRFTTIPVPADSPSLQNSGISNAFDYYGNDQTDMLVTSTMAGNSSLMPPQGPVMYCASYRLGWVFIDTTANPPSRGRALRADVRVWWAKETGTTPKNTSSTLAQDFPGCFDDGRALNPPGLGGVGDQFDNYHVVYLSTVIRPMR
jgi:prepilin-type N-terminal cleavage/methylation domain-containing protein